METIRLPVTNNRKHTASQKEKGVSSRESSRTRPRLPIFIKIRPVSVVRMIPAVARPMVCGRVLAGRGLGGGHGAAGGVRQRGPGRGGGTLEFRRRKRADKIPGAGL